MKVVDEGGCGITVVESLRTTGVALPGGKTTDVIK